MLQVPSINFYPELVSNSKICGHSPFLTIKSFELMVLGVFVEGLGESFEVYPSHDVTQSFPWRTSYFFLISGFGV